MGIEKELAESLVERIVMRMPRVSWERMMHAPTNMVNWKRILPPKQKFLDRLIDMQVFFCEITGKEPTKVIMGHKQQRELDLELRDLRMVMMPHEGWKGMLVGMNVYFDHSESRLEVTC
jgi:hypothetical protein